MAAIPSPSPIANPSHSQPAVAVPQPPHRIYDIASGHGLLAVLLAYRFPTMKVLSLDREKRDGFAHYVSRSISRVWLVVITMDFDDY